MGGAMGESDKTPRRSAKKARCAIYTRKSSEEGLEQAFNSLDAQREACAAFILSQKHEGWMVLPTLYDDGGFSGGTMERPALKRPGAQPYASDLSDLAEVRNLHVVAQFPPEGASAIPGGFKASPIVVNDTVFIA